MVKSGSVAVKTGSLVVTAERFTVKAKCIIVNAKGVKVNRVRKARQAHERYEASEITPNRYTSGTVPTLTLL